MRIMVYSHDTFGLGNVRRMLSICEHLLQAIDNLSILLVSGSPILHSFRLPPGLDYIKLPCLNRGESGQLSAKYLKTEIAETVRLRADLILGTVAHFKPDILLVDKKPAGLENELRDTLKYIKLHLSGTRLVLLLRDILDAPTATMRTWQKDAYSETIRLFYDRVLIVGSAQVFDVNKEYQLPLTVAEKVHFCGYIRKAPGPKNNLQVRGELDLPAGERLVLVTPGGGEDGFHLVEHYLKGLTALGTAPGFQSVIVCGPEMSPPRQSVLFQAARQFAHVQICEFTDDMLSLMGAADVVVSMGGYNTVCEILSLQKRSVVVPRVRPVQEQWIRCERLAQLGLLRTIHPDRLDPETLIARVVEALESGRLPQPQGFDLEALPRIAHHLLRLVRTRGHARTKAPGEKHPSMKEVAIR